MRKWPGSSAIQMLMKPGRLGATATQAALGLRSSVQGRRVHRMWSHTVVTGPLKQPHEEGSVSLHFVNGGNEAQGGGVMLR